MIPKIIVLILVVLQCDINTTTCIPSCYFSCTVLRSNKDQETDSGRKVPCDICANYSPADVTQVGGTVFSFLVTTG